MTLRKLLRSAALVMALALVAKCSGLVREVIVAAWFGTSAAMDAFVVAAALAALVMNWLQKPIQAVVVPLFMGELAARGEKGAWSMLSGPFATCVAMFVATAAVGVGAAPYLAMLIAPGLEAESASLAGQLARMLMVAALLQAIAHFLAAIFHAYQRFGRPGAMPAVENLVVAGGMVVLAPALGIHGLAIAAVVAALLQVLMQLPVVWGNLQHCRFRIDVKDPIVRRIVTLAVPLTIGAGGVELGRITDRLFASLLPVGRLSALAYAQQLTYAGFNVFAASLMTVLFPFLVSRANVAGYDDVARKLGRSLTVLFAIVAPISAGLVVLNEPLVRLVFQRGAFSEHSVQLTSQAVLFYALGLAAYIVSQVLSFAFYTVENTKTPVIAGLARTGVKILLSLLLVRPLAHAGLALAESLSFVVKATLLLVLLPNELRWRGYATIFRSFAASTAIAVVMALVVLSVGPVLDTLLEVGASVAGQAAGVAASAVIGAATYLALTVLLRPAQAREVYRLVQAGLGRRS
jgi:putative peptidoglycan lipid II flippase